MNKSYIKIIKDTKEKVLWIDEIWVPSSKRRRGIAKKLINKAIIRAKKIGYELKLVASELDNVDLNTLELIYIKMGFEIETKMATCTFMSYKF